MSDEVLLKVEEKINPPAHILEEAHIKDYESIYKKSIENPDAFWTEVAQDITWFKPFSKVLEWQTWGKFQKKGMSLNTKVLSL